MNTNTKLSLMDEVLMRASEQLGDITPHVMAVYYRSHPEALAHFERLAFGKRAQLEGIMVENSVYCLMKWLEERSEVEILLSGSLIHHEETLKLPPDLYMDFIDATAAVVSATIPKECASQHAVLYEVCGELRSIVDSAAARRLPA